MRNWKEFTPVFTGAIPEKRNFVQRLFRRPLKFIPVTPKMEYKIEGKVVKFRTKL